MSVAPSSASPEVSVNTHVFGVLPTGYGKSLCFTLLPFVFDKLLGTNNSIVIVITPLTAIIKDQVSS